MEGFMRWFFEFITTMLDGVLQIFGGIFKGIYKIINIPAHYKLFMSHKDEFNTLDWIFAVIAFILVFLIWVIIICLIILLIRKYIRFRRTLVGNEDLLEELADLHRDVVKLTREKEKILAMRIGQTTIPVDAINEIYNSDYAGDELDVEIDHSRIAPKKNQSQQKQAESPASLSRFQRLSAVDQKYEYYIEPEYHNELTLKDICENFRNFACSQMGLFYEIKTIRLMLAGLASTKLILLQGISGTGKTSLPYAMGKFLENDATIASVQPSWRDRTELFGFFNEFTKKFNETEVLRRIYEASYTDNINIIILDEMNIARVEYYFAEMLSILEMPDPSEWQIELVPSSWDNDPKLLKNGRLTIPQNVWYIGTANNDDSTFSVSDKVYDRAFVINLDSKGVAFDAPETLPMPISYSHIDNLYKEAMEKYPVSEDILNKISKLDIYVIQKFRIAFGNRIMKQLKMFVPCYVACGGTDIEAVDYLLATKVFRKFESLNLSIIRDEVKGLIAYLNKTFGNGVMAESIAYLERLQRMY